MEDIKDTNATIEDIKNIKLTDIVPIPDAPPLPATWKLIDFKTRRAVKISNLCKHLNPDLRATIFKAAHEEFNIEMEIINKFHRSLKIENPLKEMLIIYMNEQGRLYLDQAVKIYNKQDSTASCVAFLKSCCWNQILNEVMKG